MKLTRRVPGPAAADRGASLALAALCAVTLAACGGGDGNADATQQSAAAAAAAAGRPLPPGSDTALAGDAAAAPAGGAAPTSATGATGSAAGQDRARSDTTRAVTVSQPPRDQGGPPFLDAGMTATASRPRITPRVLQSVRSGGHAGFDRVVFEFRGDTLPGYSIAYEAGPVIACGSGDEVALDAPAALVVRLDPAQAHVDYQPTITERRRSPGLDALKEMVVTCDFEGQVEWALGLAGRVPFRVFRLRQPTRLVLDVRHAP